MIADRSPAEPNIVVAGFARQMRNFAQLLGGKAGAGLLSLLYLAIPAHNLGAHDFGLLVLLNAYVTTVGSLLAFSGFHGVVRYGAIARTEGDPASLARLIRASALLEFGCGVVAVLVAATAAGAIGPRLGWTPLVTAIAPLYSLAVLATVRATPQGILQLADRFDLIGLHQLLSPAVRAGGVVLVWMTGGGLLAYVGVWLVSALIEGGAMWVLAWRSWSKLTDKARVRGPWRDVFARRDGYIRFILTTNFDITLRELGPNLVPLVVGWMLGPLASGYWSFAARMTAVLKQPAQLLSQASYAVYVQHVTERRLAVLARLVRQSMLAAAGAGLLLLLVIALAGHRLPLLLGGRSFVAATSLVLLVTLSRAITVVWGPIGTALTALGWAGRTALLSMLTNLALLPLLPLLIRLFGLTGAGAYVIVQSMIGIIALPLMFRTALRRAAG